MKTVKYGLRRKSTGNVLGFRTVSNEGSDCCVSDSYILSDCSDRMWIVGDEMTAAFTRLYSEAWYNADYDSPENPYDADDLEVVQITIDVDPIESPLHIPTAREFIQMKYNDPGSPYYNPEHCRYIEKEMDRGKKFSLTLHDVRGFLTEMEMRKRPIDLKREVKKA